uniref:WD repeat and HMG-box DNA-binding protein 1 n=2 Tax=Lygus hesperus TaxID=30085 RepID=A0A0A9X0K5_LYGHE
MESMRYAHNEGHTDVCYSDDYKFLITCGSEGDVRVWNSVDDVDQQDLCVGERAWAVAQKGSSLYVGTDNNTVQIYTFPKLTNDGIISRFTAPTTQIVVSNDGKTVAACSCDMEIHVVDVDSMQCTNLIDHKGPVLSISLDPQQKYLVSSGCDGVVKVWSISSRDIIKQWDGLKKSNSFEHSEVLCRMDFDPAGQLLAIPFGEVVKVFERDSWNQVKTFSNLSSSDFNISKFSPCGKLLAAGTTSGCLLVWELSSERVIKEETNLSKHAITGLSWKGNSKSFVICNAMGQLGNLDVPETSFNLTERETAASPNLDDVPIPEPVFDDDDDDDDENVISLGKIKSQTMIHGSQTSLASKSPRSDDDRSVAGSIKYRSPITELQEPFQPSSTPLHLQQRFMVWNECGIVRQFNSEGVDDIDIEYHDTTRNHGLRLNNVVGHTMAALTTQAAVLACPKSEDGAPSKLVCILMKAWDGSKEWDCSMPDNEEVIGIAAGEGWAAAICDSLIVRLFTLDGTQVDVTSIPGPFVSASGSGQYLTIVFHSGVGVDSQQCLYYSEIVVDPSSKLMSIVSTKPLPMTPKSLLRWVGYSDENSLCSLDSFGMLRLLYRDQWRPICSLDNQFKSKFDHYFVVGVSEMAQNIRCILCKGSFYPPVLPKPLVNEIKWQIPLCELESEKGKLEEEYLRNRIIVANINDDSLITTDDKSAIEKTISITIMKLFALACRSGLESRALTLCESMPTVDVVKLASKYAAKIGRQHLASKVNDIASTMIRTSYPIRDDVSSQRTRERTPERPAADDIYSQDMFEDSQPVTKEKENLIQKMQQLQKKKKESVSPKPMRILKAGNPFKKAQETDSRNNVSLNDSTSDSKQTFMEWYEENRCRLQDENPLLKEGELAVAAMKQYRQRMLQTSSNPLDDLSQSSNKSEGEPKQKKTSDVMLEVPKKKRSAEEFPVDSEPRKRKADTQEDDKPKKKPNSFSKLKAFSFTKTS